MISAYLTKFFAHELTRRCPTDSVEKRAGALVDAQVDLNVYKSSNAIANALKQALAGKHKLLLAATPVQDSLLELFGPVSFIDEHKPGQQALFAEDA